MPIMATAGSTAPLTDEEREQLRQRLLQRRQELQQQQQQVLQLQGRVSQAVKEGLLAPPTPGGMAPGDDADVGKVCDSKRPHLFVTAPCVWVAALDGCVAFRCPLSRH